MDADSVNALGHLSHGLWPDSARAKTLETWSAVEALDLHEAVAMERAAQALLHRAERETPEDHPLPFFRMPVVVRAVLIMLHRNHWSYERIGRVLKKSREEVGQLAWYARLSLAATVGDHDAYPTGSSFKSPNCPPYDAANPWTQHFMDEELGTPERLFLQNHMVGCTTCRKALHRCRELIFGIESMLPQGGAAFAQDLRQDLKRAYWVRPAEGIGFNDALLRFLDRPETRRWAGLLIAGGLLGLLLF